MYKKRGCNLITFEQIAKKVSERYQELKPKASAVGQRIDFQMLVREQVLAAGCSADEISNTVGEVNKIFAERRRTWAERKKRKAS